MSVQSTTSSEAVLGYVVLSVMRVLLRSWSGLKLNALLNSSVEVYHDIVIAKPQAPSPAASATEASLTIGDLPNERGCQPATLRMWESRHGFPRPQRRDSGHRRYAESDVGLVMQVIRRRDAGVRLEVAIAEVALAQASVQSPPSAPSVYAALRRSYPSLQPQRLKKSSLIALSWAIEDECCARAESPMIFGSFQEERYFRACRGALDGARSHRPVDDGIRRLR